MSKYAFNVNNFSIEKDERFIAYVDFIDANRIVKLLNKQEKRIKSLEEELKDYSDDNARLEERIETLKEDVEIILDYALNMYFAMTVKEQKAHNRLRGFIRGDIK